MNSVTKEPYPFWIPPGNLGTRNSREWTAKEAKAYFQWVMESGPARIQKLLEYFEEVDESDHKQLLLNLGRKAMKVFLLDDFSVQKAQGRDLTDRGYALAADVGLLLGKMLVNKSGDKLKWTILRRSKRDISFNMPVLTGFRVTGVMAVDCDPILISIAQASGLLDGTRGEDVWWNIYDVWKDEIPT